MARDCPLAQGGGSAADDRPHTQGGSAGRGGIERGAHCWTAELLTYLLSI